MENFFETLLAAIVIALYLVPVIIALVLATFAANFFAALFRPITEPIHGFFQMVFEFLLSPLDRIPAFPTIKRYFGSSKNILFICFVIIFLIVHYVSMGSVGSMAENISLLFPGTALEQVTTNGSYDGKFILSDFFVNPENYLRTIIFSFITGLFMHIGCTTKDEDDGKIHILVKVLYMLLISLFSSVVLGMIPPDMFHISIPEISLDFASTGAVTGDSTILSLLAELRQWGSVLLKELVGILPAIVALYFLAHSVSGFAAAFLGGFIAISAVAIGWPDGFANPNSFQSAFLLLFMLAVGEVIALMFSEMLNKFAGTVMEGSRELFGYYNIISLLISYFFYPLFGLSLLCLLSLIINGFDFLVLAVCVVSLLVFSLSIFGGYKLTRCTLKSCGSLNGTAYGAAMVVNIPIWIIYIVIFIV